MEEREGFGVTDILMLLAILFWAVNFSLIKIALREFSPLGFNGIRLTLASLILITVLFLSGNRLSFAKSDIPKIFFLGLIGNTFYQLFFIHGLNWTTASNTSIIMAMTPVFVALLSTLLKQEKIHWAGWLGIGISFIGFYLIISGQVESFHFSWEKMRGDLMILGGNIFWAVYTVFSKPSLEKISPLKWTSVTLAVGTVFYIPFAARDVVRIQWSEVSFQAWAVLVYSALIAIAGCYVIWYASVKRVGNSKTAVYGYLSPIFTIIFAYFLLSERITFLEIGSALIIFAGVYLTRSGYRFFERKKASGLSR
jgi:drug/metabolite transporter (DMT)-like permease